MLKSSRLCLELRAVRWLPVLLVVPTDAQKWKRNWSGQTWNSVSAAILKKSCKITNTVESILHDKRQKACLVFIICSSTERKGFTPQRIILRNKPLTAPRDSSYLSACRSHWPTSALWSIRTDFAFSSSATARPRNALGSWWSNWSFLCWHSNKHSCF